MKKIRRFLEFMKEEKGIGVVEVILILVVNLTLQKGVWIAYIK